MVKVKEIFKASFFVLWRVLQPLCFAWLFVSVVTLSFINIDESIMPPSKRGEYNKAYTAADSYSKFDNAYHKALSHSERMTIIHRDKISYINKHYNKSYLCETTGYFGLAKTCENSFIQVVMNSFYVPFFEVLPIFVSHIVIHMFDGSFMYLLGPLLLAIPVFMLVTALFFVKNTILTIIGKIKEKEI